MWIYWEFSTIFSVTCVRSSNFVCSLIYWEAKMICLLKHKHRFFHCPLFLFAVVNYKWKWLKPISAKNHLAVDRWTTNRINYYFRYSICSSFFMDEMWFLLLFLVYFSIYLSIRFLWMNYCHRLITWLPVPRIFPYRRKKKLRLKQ